MLVVDRLSTLAKSAYIYAFHGHSSDVSVPFFAAPLVKRHPNDTQNAENVREHNGVARQLARSPAHFGIDLSAVSVTHAPITLT